MLAASPDVISMGIARIVSTRVYGDGVVAPHTPRRQGSHGAVGSPPTLPLTLGSNAVS
jgi:hypothetical protein